MPHATDQEERSPPPRAQAEQETEDDLINKLLGGSDLEALGNLNDRELEIGEKADDAEDFEDIADDDLADDEDEKPANNAQDAPQVKEEAADEFEGLFEEDHDGNNGDGYGNDLDELFGTDDEASSPPIVPVKTGSAQEVSTPNALDALFSRAQQDRSASVESMLAPQEETQELAAPEEEDEEDEDEETREQRLLFQQAREQREMRMRGADYKGELPPPAESHDELFSLVWPQYEPKAPPRFGELLPGKKAYYVGKKPVKAVKPVHPTKLSLELQQDQEKLFKLSDYGLTAFSTRQAEAEAKGVVLIEESENLEVHSEDEQQLVFADDTEDVAGVSWQDFVALCEDWDIPDGASSTAEIELDREQEDTFDIFDDDAWADQVDSRPAKVGLRVNLCSTFY